MASIEELSGVYGGIKVGDSSQSSGEQTVGDNNTINSSNGVNTVNSENGINVGVYGNYTNIQNNENVTNTGIYGSVSTEVNNNTSVPRDTTNYENADNLITVGKNLPAKTGFWNKVKSANIDIVPGISGKKQDLLLCRHCSFVYNARFYKRCPRCGHIGRVRNYDCYQKAAALLLSAIILYLPCSISSIVIYLYLSLSKVSRDIFIESSPAFFNFSAIPSSKTALVVIAIISTFSIVLIIATSSSRFFLTTGSPPVILPFFTPNSEASFTTLYICS